MTVATWKVLSPEEREKAWPRLSAEDKTAIMADEAAEEVRAARAARPAPAATEPVTPAAFEAPFVCTFLYGIGGIALVASFFMLFQDSLRPAGIAILGSGITMLLAGKAFDYLAQTAYYARRTAELLGERK